MSKEHAMGEKEINAMKSSFLDNLRRGRICVHPTDTVPGLTCDPRDTSALDSLERIKKRSQKKPFVGLLASFDQAFHYWQDLPPFWHDLIPKIWPEAITFVWKARSNVPVCFLSKEGELALRCPKLPKDALWFQKVLETLDSPLPSTSINYEGEASLTDEKELKEFCKIHDVYLPAHLPQTPAALPSSIIRITKGAHFEWLRKGAFSESNFVKIHAAHIHKGHT